MKLINFGIFSVKMHIAKLKKNKLTHFFPLLNEIQLIIPQDLSGNPSGASVSELYTFAMFFRKRNFEFKEV